MSTVAAYLRVSTDKQTTANQRPEVEGLAKRRGMTIAKVFEESESAVKRRPVFEKMMADAQSQKFDTLLIWSLDRLGRDLAGNLDAVRRLDLAGVTVVSAREPWLDTSGPTRDLLIAIFSWVAQFERRRLVERTRAGLDRARAEGIKLGRPKASQSKVADAVALVAGGLSPEAAASKVGIGASTVRRSLQVTRKGQPNGAVKTGRTTTAAGQQEVT
jgi:DNA invertase Pin-like site-specific DNA recombinase